jgi:hypothetical protein
MVLTGAVRTRGTGHGRRQVLGVTVAGLGAAGLAGCGLFDDGPAPRPAADPLQPLLRETVALVAAYERAAVAQPGLAARLAPLAGDHRAHAAELAKVIGTAVPSGVAASAQPAGAAAAAVLAGLRAAEQAAQRNAVAACRQAPAARAALLGSIAACRASHAEALR